MKKNSQLIIYFLLIFSVSGAQIPELWGLTTYGGAHDKGSIFKVNGDGSNFVNVFSFDSVNGSNPEGSLCLAPNGKFYGTAKFGGSQNAGTIFNFNPNGNLLTKILDFNFANGSDPYSTMVVATNGLLYGGGIGNIFSIDPQNDAYTNLHTFTINDGVGFTDKLLQASNGDLYGLNSSFGANNKGTIFKYNIATGAFTKVYDFDGTNGATPYGTLCEATNGFFYGLARAGGINNIGTLFKFDPATNVYTKLFDFDTINGQWPWNSMIQVTSTKLYGMVSNGGATGAGLIFSYDINTGAYSVEHDFDILTEGALPWGSLIKATDNMLYGTTSIGYNGGTGAVFKFDYTTNSLNIIHDFILSEGSNPPGDLVEYTTTGLNETNSNLIFYISPNPVQATLLLNFNGQLNENSVLSISNLFGEIFYKSKLTEQSFSTLDVSKLVNGIYLLQIENDKGVSTQKFLKLE